MTGDGEGTGETAVTGEGTEERDGGAEKSMMRKDVKKLKLPF